LTSTLPSSGILPPASLMDMLCSVASCWTRTKLGTHSKTKGSDSVLRIIKERGMQMAISLKYAQENTSDILYTGHTSLCFACSELFLPSYCRGRDYCCTWSHSMTRTKVGRTPLHEGSARRRGLYLTKHNTYKK
jgi:hypothetical protein